MTENPFEYTDEEIEEMNAALDTFPSSVVDGEVMVSVNLVDQISVLLIHNMQVLGERGLVCDAEAMHTVITADYIRKMAGFLRLKYADRMVPDNIGELLEIPED